MSTEPTPLHVERIGTKTYIGRNARGGEVRIGGTDADGVLSPGELLSLALAACGLLSADHTFASRLGEDFAATVDITPHKTADGQRYDAINATIRANMDSLEADKAETLVGRVERAIERSCTIGHTLDHGAEHPISIVHDPGLSERL